jgi:ribosomal protein S18 acetylase RimI-like enzyme
MAVMSNLSSMIAAVNVPPATALRVTPSQPEDRRAIYDILLNSGIFGRSDAECVDQMFAEALAQPGEDSYRFLSCWEDDRIVGFACFGHESLTQDTWDLFWVCVSGAARRKGAGRALLSEAQHRAAQERGRLMVIYTSSTQKYAPARSLYESLGFARAAVVPDYYADSDDLCIYAKRLNQAIGEEGVKTCE